MTALVTCILKTPEQNKTGLNPDIRETKPKLNKSLSLNCVD